MKRFPLAILVRVNSQLLRAKVAALQQQSLLMLTVIWLFVGAYWIFGYQLFYEGLRYVNQLLVMGAGLLDQLLYIFFGFLLLMLFFSNVIIGYATFFRNQETQWLMTKPVAFSDILRWKWLETMILASWAFVFLSGPLLLAYGQVRGFSWIFYVKAAVLYVPFLVLPAAAAALATLLIARFVPRWAFKVALIVGGALVLAGVFWGMKPRGTAEVGAQFDRIMTQTKFASHPLWPSAWMVNSLIFEKKNSLINAGVLLSNALLLGLGVYSASGRMFYSAWSQVHGRGDTRGGMLSNAGRTLLRLLENALRCVPSLSRPMRALILKDIRTFFRDTVQWSQFTIFFGLLGIYVLNLRHVANDDASAAWSHMVSFLNLVACAMTLATLTTRFVFPQFSLEGKRLWIVGLAPMGLRKVLLEKFWLASFGGITITATLMLVSSLMLRQNISIMLLFCGTVVLMGFGLAGLAVGLGALYPNFKDDNPSKIVSGFGGTFCLVLSMTYVTACVGIEAMGIRHYLRSVPGASLNHPDPVTFAISIAPTLLTVLTLSLAIAGVPMVLAIRRLKTLEI